MPRIEHFAIGHPLFGAKGYRYESSPKMLLSRSALASLVISLHPDLQPHDAWLWTVPEAIRPDEDCKL
jgi:hypothetical protein